LTVSRFRSLPLLFTVAFGLRLAAGVVLGLNPAPTPGSDEKEYDTYAWNLAQGRGYRGPSPDVSDEDHLTAYRPPGPSMVWAGLFCLFGHTYWPIVVSNCLFEAGVATLLVPLGRLSFSSAAGWIAGWGWTIFPTSIYYSTSLLSESQATFVLCLFLFVCLQFARSPNWSRGAIAGLLLGWLLLVHPTKVFLFPLVLVWGCVQFLPDPRAVARFCAIPLLAVLVLVPWTVRNYYVFGRFIPFSTMGGSALLQANNRFVLSDPTLYGYSIWDTKIPEYADQLRAPNDEYERDAVAKRLAIEWLSENRDLWPTLALAKLHRGLTPILQPHSPWHYRFLMFVSWAPVLVLAALSFFATLFPFVRNKNPAWLLHLNVFHFLILTVIFHGNARYRYTIEPVCLIFAAVTVHWLTCQLSNRLRQPYARPAQVSDANGLTLLGTTK
jgi:4-amino-4-deoxy-L-arabinose transferase-like glycosyltransferase